MKRVNFIAIMYQINFLIVTDVYSEIAVCITVKIQYSAIEMCAECTVTLLCSTCTELGLHSLHSEGWEVLKTSSGSEPFVNVNKISHIKTACSKY